MNLSPTATEVEVTALYFRNKTRAEHLESYPRQMIWGGQEYNFVECGMQYLVRKGQQLVRLFDMSDGDRDYRLRLENNHWTLVSMKATA